MSHVEPHDERRAAISLLVADLIAEIGLGNATIRRIAQESGFSTRAVTYYFPDKRSMLLQVYSDAARRLGDRLRAVQAAAPFDLHGMLEALLPTSPDVVREWKVHLAYWDLAATDPELNAIQRRNVQGNVERMERIMGERRAAGYDRLINPADGRRLIVIIQGIAVQALFDPIYWTPAAQRAFLADELDRVR